MTVIGKNLPPSPKEKVAIADYINAAKISHYKWQLLVLLDQTLSRFKQWNFSEEIYNGYNKYKHVCEHRIELADA